MTYEPKHRGVATEPEGKFKYRIVVTEHERGWGSRSEYEYFDTPEEAQERINFINSFNTAPTAPDWYMNANGPVEAVEAE